MTERFRTAGADTRLDKPRLEVRLRDGKPVRVDLEIDEDGIVVVNVRPAIGVTLDVELHGPMGSRLLT